jgi:hypothetical protein
MIFMMKRLQLSYCNSSKENNNQGMQHETIYASPEIPRNVEEYCLLRNTPVSDLENMQKHCMPLSQRRETTENT